MFKVRAKLIGFLGDEDKYPCHFKYKVGDEIIWDGEKFIGRICPYMLTEFAAKIYWLFSAGPRYREVNYYLPLWYASLSLKDPGRKKYDGIGWKPVLKSQEPFPGFPEETFKWPPPSERSLFKDTKFECPDVRTRACFKLEAFDLADNSDSIPYFRRQMVILDRVLKKQGIKVDKILDEFTDEEKYEIYPPLSPVLVEMLIEELALLNYLELRNGKTYVTDKGKAKLEDFKKSLSQEEKMALNLK